MGKKLSLFSGFTPYQIFAISILTFLQFTIVLDFMVLSPLSAILLPELDITTTQFSLVVSAYAFSAGISGFLASGFADKFDRKKLLLFFYTGFLLGTFLCGIAPTYTFLLFARIITGIFGGVIGSVVFAITTDLFEVQQRGRVMGFVQMAFSASQILGMPIGLKLATQLNWHAPFILIVSISLIVYVIIALKLKPITEHLKIKRDRTAFQHFKHTVRQRRYLIGFAATSLLATGGFMLMPFGSAFSVNNLMVDMKDVPTIYLAAGICSLIAGPLVGSLSDRVGKFQVFVGGTILSMILVLVYCNLGATPLWIVVALNSVLFIGITTRIIGSSALMSTVPDPADRGAYMGINSAIQQISGGIAAFAAGLIVVKEDSGRIDHYGTLAIVVVIAMLITVLMMAKINKMVKPAMEAARQKAMAGKEPQVVIHEG